jgi:hypothetical protein
MGAETYDKFYAELRRSTVGNMYSELEAYRKIRNCSRAVLLYDLWQDWKKNNPTEAKKVQDMAREEVEK